MEVKENYYRLSFTNDVSEVYAYGTTALQAVANARDDMSDIALGSVIARRAVYGEWKRDLNQDGQIIA